MPKLKNIATPCLFFTCQRGWVIRLVTNLSSFLFYISIRLGNVNTHVRRRLCRVRPSKKHPRLKKYYTTMRFFYMSAGWVIHVVTYVSSRLMVLSTNKHMDIATSTLSCWHPACGHPSCGVDTFACWYGIGFVLAMQVLLLLHLVSYKRCFFCLQATDIMNRHTMPRRMHTQFTDFI